jgi:hypothetical protein
MILKKAVDFLEINSLIIFSVHQKIFIINIHISHFQMALISLSVSFKILKWLIVSKMMESLLSLLSSQGRQYSIYAGLLL